MKKIIIFLIVLISGIAIFVYFNPTKKVEKKNKNNENNEKIVDIKENKKEKKEVQLEKNNYVSYNGKLKVSNTYLVNQYDEKILLKGISTHGIQWFGDLVTKENIKKLKEEFNINVFRIAMYTEEGGYISNRNLKDKVNEIVGIAKELDLYVIIDWHILSDNNPNNHIEEAKEFFDEMANKYKDTPNVIFEICNEPNGNTSWDDVKKYADVIIPIIRKYTDNIYISILDMDDISFNFSILVVKGLLLKKSDGLLKS